MNSPFKQNIFLTWAIWQFYEVPKFLLLAWKNFLFFSANFFSTPLLIKTLFAPWRRYFWQYPKRIDLGEYLNVFISNLFSRLIGSMMRIILIMIGFCFQIIVFILGLIIFIFWLLLPLIIIAMIFASFI